MRRAPTSQHSFVTLMFVVNQTAVHGGVCEMNTHPACGQCRTLPIPLISRCRDIENTSAIEINVYFADTDIRSANPGFEQICSSTVA